MKNTPRIGGKYTRTWKSGRRTHRETGYIGSINHKDHTCCFHVSPESCDARGIEHGTDTVKWSSLSKPIDDEERIAS